MKRREIKTIKTIAELHSIYGLSSPVHPLISVMDLKTVRISLEPGIPFTMSFYVIACKRFGGAIQYGHSTYDFSEGTMMFTAPEQVVRSGTEGILEEGWALFFHPDLIRGTDLERRMHQYSFFNYETNEALHISEDEKKTLENCIYNIKKEFSLNLDKHSHKLIASNIELLLNYCVRFYDRQFITRSAASNDLVTRFEHLLRSYFSQDTKENDSLPDVKYFADRLRLSPNYLSDLLTRYTGKTTQEHIHLQLIEKAKKLLWNSNKSVSEIAYELGFEYPSHFSKIFKAKTGQSPKGFRIS